MWDLQPSAEQAMIVGSVADYLARELPLERLRPKTPPRDVARVYGGMAELGWLGIGLPDRVGGSGLGLVEEMLIQRECGRTLVSPSILATVLGAHVAFHAGDETLASAMIAGRRWAALAIPGYAFDWTGNELLLAWNDQGMGLFDPEAFTHAQPDECLDDSVTMHVGALAMSRPRHWVRATQAPLGSRAQILLAACLTGLADHACGLTVTHAKLRQQFGKPIGTFQAVKHRCADMAIRARLTWCQTALACLKVQAGSPDASLQAAAAKFSAANAAHENARAAIQLHGAIGFQAECDVHWFMKRAHVYDQAGGGMQAQAQRIMAEPSPLW